MYMLNNLYFLQWCVLLIKSAYQILDIVNLKSRQIRIKYQITKDESITCADAGGGELLSSLKA